MTIGFELPRDPKKKALSRRKDLDLMLNDWGIHHLHISTEVEADGFVKRTKPLIFAIFKPERAYLIDIMRHGDWAAERIIRVILEAWPDEGLVSELRGIKPSERTWSDQHRLALRRAGITTAISIDGRAYLPGPGMSSDGSSPRVLWKASSVLRQLANFEVLAIKHEDAMIGQIREQSGRIDGRPAYKFAVFENGFGVIETNSGKVIPLGP